MALLDNVRKHYTYALQDKKRLLEEITLPGQKASDVLTFVGQPGNGKTVTIDGKVYTFQTVLTDVDGNVAIGATLADSIANLVAAINLGTGAGTLYAASMTAHTTVSAAVGSSTTLIATALVGGAAGNSLAAATNVTGASWATPTLTGGSSLADDVRDKAIASGVAWYTRILPRFQVKLVTANPSGSYEIPSDWLDGVSRIVAIRTPADTLPPSFQPLSIVQMIPMEDGTANLYYLTPNPKPSFRLYYLANHGATVALPAETLVGSIPADHEGPVGRMAAAIASREFAGFYGQTAGNEVDSVNYRTKADEWRSIAKALDEMVRTELRAAELDFALRSNPKAYFQGWS